MKMVQVTFLNPAEDRNGVSAVINLLNEAEDLKQFQPEIVHPYLNCRNAKQRFLNHTLRITRSVYKSCKSESVFYFLLKLNLLKMDSHVPSGTTVIHAHDPLSALYFSEKYRQKKIVLTHHYSNLPWVEYEKAGYVRRGSFIFRLLRKKLAAGMKSEKAAHVFVSEARRRETKRILKSDIKGDVVYNSVQLPYMGDPEKTDRNKMITIGRIEEAKNHIGLIQVMKILTQSGIGITLEIIGDDSSVYAGELKQLVKRENLESVVSISGVMTHFEAMKKLQNATLYVHTAKSESFGISLLEAMLLNKPVLAYDYPALKEIIGVENRYLQSTEQGNYRKLAENIISVLRDKKLAEKITDAQKKRIVQLFSVEKMARFYQCIYLNLTKKGITL